MIVFYSMWQLEDTIFYVYRYSEGFPNCHAAALFEWSVSKKVVFNVISTVTVQC